MTTPSTDAINGVPTPGNGADAQHTLSITLLTNTARQAEGVYRQLTSSLRLLPDFLIIGAQKGGTTSLYNYLIEHPNILAARKKEVHFFDQHSQRGVSWYRSHFATTTHKQYLEQVQQGKVLTGEGSPE